MRNSTTILLAVLVAVMITALGSDLQAQGANACMCPCPCPASSAPSAQAAPPPPPQQGYTGGADTRSQPVDTSYAPPEARGSYGPPQQQNLPPPPPHQNLPPPPAQAHGAQTASGHSDLPSDWVEPVQLPPGAIRIEDLRGRSIMGTPSQAPASQASSPPVQQSYSTQPVEEFSSGVDNEGSTSTPQRWH